MIINQNNLNHKGYIFDIQGLSVHDGPGCRTLIFLTGCTLDCFWCSNPEGISHKPTILHFEKKCAHCYKCVENCSKNAISAQNHKIKIQREKCIDCIDKNCLKECYTDALKLGGYEITAAELYRIIQRDRQFWGNQGGITLTGGEPLLQITFAENILAACYEAYIHTAIETCGNVPWTHFQRVIPFLDWIFFDLKHFDSDVHKNATGANNTLILDNAQKLATEFKGRMIFRLPLIPGFNDSEENIQHTIDFLKTIKKFEINILPLHHLGREKYTVLDKKYLGDNYAIPDENHLATIKQKFNAQGIECYIGSKTPF